MFCVCCSIDYSFMVFFEDAAAMPYHFSVIFLDIHGKHITDLYYTPRKFRISYFYLSRHNNYSIPRFTDHIFIYSYNFVFFDLEYGKNILMF